MSAIDDDIAKIIDGLMSADAAVPSVIAEARRHLPAELWPVFDARVAPILEAASPEAAREKFVAGFAGVLKSFQDGHGPTGHHSVHAG